LKVVYLGLLEQELLYRSDYYYYYY